MSDNETTENHAAPHKAGIPWRELVVAWRDAGLLVAVAAVAALAFNALRPAGLPLLRYAPFDLLGPCPELADEIPRLAPEKLKIGDPNVVVVDVRLPWDHLEGRLPGSWFMPMYETAPLDPAVVARLKAQKPGTWIVLVGTAGTATAERALTALSGQGLRGLFVLEGGLEAWRKLGRPVDSTTVPVLVRESGNPAARLYVDARDDAAFADGHRDGAVHLPFDDLLPPEPEILDRLRQVQDRELVVYAGEPVPDRPGGHRPVHPAYGVAAELVARGFPRVSILAQPYVAPSSASDPPASPEVTPSGDGTPVSSGVTHE